MARSPTTRFQSRRTAALIALGLMLAPSVANATPDLDQGILYFWIIPINAVGLVVGLLSSWLARIPVIRLLVIAACLILLFPGLLIAGEEFISLFYDRSFDFEVDVALLYLIVSLDLLPLAMYFLGRAITAKLKKLYAANTGAAR